MQLHELRKNSHKRAQRIGRGGKRGSYSGRGVKGQHSRAGRRIRPAERDLILRLPKQRGFANKPKGDKPKIFNLRDLAPLVAAHGKTGKPVVIDREFLQAAGLLPRKYKGAVKILGMGEVGTPIGVRGLKLSKSAKMKIEGKAPIEKRS